MDNRIARFDIYAGYYLPDSFSVEIPRNLTTVNAFPLILNTVFGTDFEIRENRLLELVDYKRPFVQFDVTEDFRSS